MMEHFKEFESLMQKLNPEHSFNEEELSYLRSEFAELKIFIQSLSSPIENANKICFDEVLQDEIFYYESVAYVKMNSYAGRVWHRSKANKGVNSEREFLKKDDVFIVKKE